MSLVPKRIIAAADNPLFKKAHPVLLSIFCRGVHAAESKQLVLGAALSIITSPAGWVVAIVSKLLHLAIVVAIWWFLRAEIAALGVSEYVALTLGIVVVLYRELYDELVDLLLYLLILITGGGFLRWICTGYSSGTGIVRQIQFTSAPMERLVGCMVNIIPNEYRNQYEEIMNLYIDSNKPESETRLNHLLDEYLLQEANGSSATK
jgi:hypothetical protein